VREETLAITATEIKLNQYIFISKGEQRSQGRQKAAILADCLEALIGYLYVDCGYDTASYFIKKYLYKKVNNIEDYIPVKSHKSRVQEYIQKLYKILPNYRDTQDQIDETGNIIRYKSELYLNQRLLSTGY
jgi:ribonuclease-3